MTNNKFEQSINERLRKAWLCRIGHHDQPLDQVEIAALDKIIRQTGVGQLILKLSDALQEDPINLDKAESLISSIEGLGITPGARGTFELKPGSPLDKEIGIQVLANKHLSKLAVYVNTPEFATAEKVAA